MLTGQRRIKLKPDQRSFFSSQGLGQMLICLLISVWIHILFFSLWQHFEIKASEHYHFIIDDLSAPVELTLSMGEGGVAKPLSDIAATPVSISGADESSNAEEKETDSPNLANSAEQTETGAAEMSAEDLSNTALLNGEAQDETDSDKLAAVDSQNEAVPAQPPMSLEENAPKFKSYYTTVRSAVASRWIMPPEAKGQFKPGRLTVDFTIKRDGSLVRIVVLESSSSPSLDHAGLEALRSAAPFPPFPEELRVYSQLDIRMHFDYQAQYIKRKQQKNVQ